MLKKCLLNLNLHFFGYQILLFFSIFLLDLIFYCLHHSKGGHQLSSVGYNGYQTGGNSDMTEMLLKFRAIPSGLLLAMALCLPTILGTTDLELVISSFKLY